MSASPPPPVTQTSPPSAASPAAFPPRARLGRALRSLAAALPAAMGPLLEAARFRDGAAALRRLSDDGYLDRALQELSVEEAGWLAERLLERWSWLETPALIPAAAILAPDELWIGERTVPVSVSLAVAGIAPDFEPLWQGAAPVPGERAQAIVTVPPPTGDGPALVTVHVRVRARSLAPEPSGARCVLVAETRIAVRQPRVTIADDRRVLVVNDQHGRPAAGVVVEVGDTRVVTGLDGKAVLPQAVVATATALPIRVAGILAGRVNAAGGSGSGAP